MAKRPYREMLDATERMMNRPYPISHALRRSMMKWLEEIIGCENDDKVVQTDDKGSRFRVIPPATEQERRKAMQIVLEMEKHNLRLEQLRSQEEQTVDPTMSREEALHLQEAYLRAKAEYAAKQATETQPGDDPESDSADPGGTLSSEP